MGGNEKKCKNIFIFQRNIEIFPANIWKSCKYRKIIRKGIDDFQKNENRSKKFKKNAGDHTRKRPGAKVAKNALRPGIRVRGGEKSVQLNSQIIGQITMDTIISSYNDS